MKWLERYGLRDKWTRRSEVSVTWRLHKIKFKIKFLFTSPFWIKLLEHPLEINQTDQISNQSALSFEYLILIYLIICFIQISNVSMTTNQTAEFTLSTDAIAPFVWLECPRYPGTFSDNGFTMMQSKMRLTLTLRDPLPQGHGKVDVKDILVTSLIDYMG